MMRRSKAALGGAALQGLNRFHWYQAGDGPPTMPLRAEETSTMKYSISTLSETSRTQTRALTPSTLRLALAKTALVWLLAWVFAWKPRLAMVLGRLGLRVWPGFRRA
jgi:hypothetical protein